MITQKLWTPEDNGSLFEAILGGQGTALHPAQLKKGKSFNSKLAGNFDELGDKNSKLILQAKVTYLIFN